MRSLWQRSRDGLAVMTVLIWIITWLLQLLPAMGQLPDPVNLTLTSDNFIHRLHWEPGPGTPPGVHYEVTVSKTTETSWQPVCQHVQHPLVCDLTEAFSNLDQSYYTGVRALLDTQASQKVSYPEFNPRKNTRLDPPLLTVTACGTNLCVDLQPPVEHFRDVYAALYYKLKIQGNGADNEQPAVLQQREVLENLSPGREYCVSVCFVRTGPSRRSNCSKPVCVSTRSKYNTEPWISGVLCLMVLVGVAVVILLFFAGFICLRWRPLPRVLTTVQHFDRVVVITPSMSSLLNVKTTAPSAGEKRSSRTSSDESDEESQTEDTGGSSSRGGGAYKLRVGTNLLSSSSSSSSSVAAPLSPEPGATATLSDSVSPQLVVLTDGAGLNDGLSSHPDSLPESNPPADCWTGGGNKEEEEEKQEEEKQKEEQCSQDVNLLTLTFGRHKEEEEESHMESLCPSEVLNTTPLLPAQTWDAEEVAIETVPSSVTEEEEEEEEEDDSGYMRR